MKLTKSQLKQIIKEELQEITEGRFDDLKQAQKMLRSSQDFFIKLADELKVGPEVIQKFNIAAHDLLDAVFKASHERSGGRID